jgi:tetratricopeptide (TPR) repeat protein
MTIRQPAGDAQTVRIKRNALCPCGSGRRFKRCCGVPKTKTIPPDLLETTDNHYQRALELQRLGRDADAIAELRQAIGFVPDHSAALARLGDLLSGLGHRVEAMECHRRVTQGAPDTLVGRLSRAKVLAEDGEEIEAAAVLRQTVTLFPGSGDAKQLLATTLRQLGRFGEASPLLEAALGGSPGEAASAFHDLAASRKFVVADVPLLDRMRALLGSGAVPARFHARIHFGLGKAFDDLGDYARAISHYEAANGMIQPHDRLDRARLAAGVHRIITGCTPDFFDAHARIAATSDRPLLIVGMPRSGTTLVEQIVSSHRHVAAGGELTFWNTQAEALKNRTRGGLSADAAARMARDYEAILRRIDANTSRVTDKAPGNFLWIGLVRIVFPNARIIHCRRHPVDTCLSNYFTSFAEPMPFARDKADLVFYYQQYAMLMRHWRSVLPADRLHEIDYEQLVADPGPVTRRLIAFCGLDWDDACLHPEANRRPVKTASLWQVRQPTFRGSVERWRHYEPWLGDLRQLLDMAEAPLG